MIQLVDGAVTLQAIDYCTTVTEDARSSIKGFPGDWLETVFRNHFDGQPLRDPKIYVVAMEYARRKGTVLTLQLSIGGDSGTSTCDHENFRIARWRREFQAAENRIE